MTSNREAELNKRLDKVESLDLVGLALNTKSLFLRIVHHKFKVLICIMLGVAISLVYLVLVDTTYEAEVKFIVNEDEGSAGGGFGGVLSILGLGNYTQSGSANPRRILSVLRSRPVLETALLKKVSIASDSILLANAIIDTYELASKWASKGKVSSEAYRIPGSPIEAYDSTAKWAIRQLTSILAGNEKQIGLLETTVDDDTGIMIIGVETNVEDLSIALVEESYSILSQRYTEQAIKPQQAIYNTLLHKSDSIAAELKLKGSTLAKLLDQRRNVPLATNRVREEELRREIDILSIAYAKVIENLQVAEFTLGTATPYFQTIESPASPLAPLEPSLIKTLAIGTIVGAMAGLGIVLCIVCVEYIKSEQHARTNVLK